MFPGAEQILEYQEAAERLHDNPFTVLTYVRAKSEKVVGLVAYIYHKRHVFTGKTYAEAKDKAIRQLIVFGRLERIRGYEE